MSGNRMPHAAIAQEYFAAERVLGDVLRPHRACSSTLSR